MGREPSVCDNGAAKALELRRKSKGGREEMACGRYFARAQKRIEKTFLPCFPGPGLTIQPTMTTEDCNSQSAPGRGGPRRYQETQRKEVEGSGHGGQAGPESDPERH